MTCYNREQFIAEAIESVISSSFVDFELIIVDDCSNDKTLCIAESYADRDRRIRIFLNDKNLGDYPNRNKAANYARGKYIIYVDSDDMILQDGFERCVDAMEKFPHINFAIQNKGIDHNPYPMSPMEVIRNHFFDEPCLMIGPGGTIIKSDFFNKIGGYPIKYGPANDLYFNLKVASLGDVLFLPFDFNYYRFHSGQEQNNKYNYLFNNFNYLRDALIELNLPLKVHEKNWLMNKNRRRFIVNCIKYFIKNPNLNKIHNALQLANFKYIDLVKAIVHSSL